VNWYTFYIVFYKIKLVWNSSKRLCRSIRKMFRLCIVFKKERMNWGVMIFSLLEMYQCFWATFCPKKKPAGPTDMLVNFCLNVLCHVPEHNVHTHSSCCVCFMPHNECLKDCSSILNHYLRPREQHIIWAFKGETNGILYSCYMATRCVLHWNEEGI
jgi:hypothetical protein